MKLCDTLNNIVKHNNMKLRTFIVITVCNRLMNSFTVRTVTEHYKLTKQTAETAELSSVAALYCKTVSCVNSIVCERPERRYQENYRYRDRIGEGHFGSHEDM